MSEQETAQTWMQGCPRKEGVYIRDLSGFAGLRQDFGPHYARWDAANGRWMKAARTIEAAQTETKPSLFAKHNIGWREVE